MEVSRKRLKVKDGEISVDQGARGIKDHVFNNSQGNDTNLVATHTMMDALIDKEVLRQDFQEQLQDIDDELARFENNEGR